MNIGRKKRALITGITGQDGSYLAELLLEKGYEVHGLVRRVALEDPTHRMTRIQHLIDSIHFHFGTLESYPSIFDIVDTVKPDECYHLAAQSFVSYSFDDQFSTMSTNINGTHYVLSAIKKRMPECKFYFAGSSEMFGKVKEVPQTEETPFHPRSPYGISKVAGFELTRNYRESYGMFCVSGILFNHESPRRGFEFVTRKLSSHAAMIKFGMTGKIKLGNLDAKRDWGHAKDYVYAQWLMLQQDEPDDYVVATGKNHSVRDFLETAFKIAGLDYTKHYEIDERLYRPAEVNVLLGDATKAREKLGWKPTVSFESLVQEMVEEDIKYYKSHGQFRDNL
ncbi:MAG: GDP-mannose 4,6-dehydratase [Candidatus Scalinduaceae bacterium]